jgi:hypothetical protein
MGAKPQIKIGDAVKLTGVPSGLTDADALMTKSAFEKCVGSEFQVAGFNDYGMAEIIIESVTGNIGETIWVEPQFLTVISK